MSAHERTAIVEAKRAEKDIRQAIRGRFAALARVNQRVEQDPDFVPDAALPRMPATRKKENMAKAAAKQRRKEADPKSLVDTYINGLREMHRQGDEFPLREFIQQLKLTPKEHELPMDELNKLMVQRRTAMTKALEDSKAKVEKLSGSQRHELEAEISSLEGGLIGISSTLDRLAKYHEALFEKRDAYVKDPLAWHDLVREHKLTSRERRIAAYELFDHAVFGEREVVPVNANPNTENPRGVSMAYKGSSGGVPVVKTQEAAGDQLGFDEVEKAAINAQQAEESVVKTGEKEVAETLQNGAEAREENAESSREKAEEAKEEKRGWMGMFKRG